MPSSSNTSALARLARRWAADPSRANSIKSCRDAASRKPGRIMPFGRVRSSRFGKPENSDSQGVRVYIAHDAERERPVHFAWQLLEWPIPSDVLAGMGLTLEQEEAGTETPRAISDGATGAAQS